MAVLKRYTATFTPNVVYTKELTPGGKTLVTEVEYTINAHETANSSKTLQITNQYLTFNYFAKDTNGSGFVDIDSVTDNVVAGWIADHFSTRELALNSLLSMVSGVQWSADDDIDLDNPYG